MRFLFLKRMFESHRVESPTPNCMKAPKAQCRYDNEKLSATTFINKFLLKKEI